MPRRAHHDNNHRIITLAMEAAGCLVYDTASQGEGFPDCVVVAPDGRVFLVEIKAEGGGRLKDSQVEFLIRAVVGPIRIFHDPTQAARVVRGGG